MPKVGGVGESDATGGCYDTQIESNLQSGDPQGIMFWGHEVLEMYFKQWSSCNYGRLNVRFKIPSNKLTQKHWKVYLVVFKQNQHWM